MLALKKIFTFVLIFTSLFCFSQAEQSITLELKAFLEGSYNPDNYLMNDYLRQGNDLPLQEPFTGFGFQHVIGGGESFSQDILSVTGENAIVDWIMVELKDGDHSNITVATQSALIQRDGDIVAVDGVSPLSFILPLAINSIYVVLHHRNHLGVRTLYPLDVANNNSVDFTSSTTEVYGENSRLEIDGVMVLISGDANFDGQINPVDHNDYWREYNGEPYSYMYSTADYNLDGAVNAVDKNNIWRLNNSMTEQLPSDSIPLLYTNVTLDVTNSSATSGGFIENNGGSPVTERGVCYNTSPYPTTNNSVINEGSGIGFYTSNITGLTENTIYYVRAYAINNHGTAYGDQKQFTTQSNTSLPVLTTNVVTNVTEISATLGGNISYDGGSAITVRGVCLNTVPNPTLDNFSTENGTGVGSFTVDLTGFTANTTYYVRAYAINNQGTAYGQEEVFTTNNSSTSFTGEIVLVSGGTYQMGGPTFPMTETQEYPQHSVTLSSFIIGKYEITNQQYASFLNAINANPDGTVGGVEYLSMLYSQISHNGSQFVVDAGKANYPMMQVTWHGANAFCEFYGGRLPTEAEWEFAARGGNASNGYTYSGSDNVDIVAWYFNNSTNPDNDLTNGKGTHIVGTKYANELGLYDMSGNLKEWVNDWYVNNYNNSASYNPQGPASGFYKATRGGSWYLNANNSRVAKRTYKAPSQKTNYIGFRIAFDV